MLSKPVALIIPKWKPATPDDHSDNLRQLDRWANELIVPQPYIARVDNLATWTTTSATFVYFADNGAGASEVNKTWLKRHDWTDVIFDAAVSAYNTASPAGYAFFLGASHRPDISGSTNTDIELARIHVDGTNSPKGLSGFARVTGLRSGRYISNLRARTAGGNLKVDAGHFGALRILEVVPESI